MHGNKAIVFTSWEHCLKAVLFKWLTTVFGRCKCLIVDVYMKNVTENSTFKNLCTFGCLKIRKVHEGVDESRSIKFTIDKQMVLYKVHV